MLLRCLSTSLAATSVAQAGAVRLTSRGFIAPGDAQLAPPAPFDDPDAAAHADAEGHEPVFAHDFSPDGKMAPLPADWYSPDAKLAPRLLPARDWYSPDAKLAPLSHPVDNAFIPGDLPGGSDVVHRGGPQGPDAPFLLRPLAGTTNVNERDQMLQPRGPAQQQQHSEDQQHPAPEVVLDRFADHLWRQFSPSDSEQSGAFSTCSGTMRRLVSQDIIDDHRLLMDEDYLRQLDQLDEGMKRMSLYSSAKKSSSSNGSAFSEGFLATSPKKEQEEDHEELAACKISKKQDDVNYPLQSNKTTTATTSNDGASSSRAKLPILNTANSLFSDSLCSTSIVDQMKKDMCENLTPANFRDINDIWVPWCRQLAPAQEDLEY
ncbi:unnamed protein product [Amoebophrya sp. A120]|nr:unnamed protein product [Amoebophrya sp. A120]|eukprot:GSA120T00004445001.1